MNPDIEKIIEEIDKALERRQEKPTRASLNAGLGASYIRDLHRYRTIPNMGKFSKLANYLGLNVNGLSDLAKIDDARPMSVISLPVVGSIAAGAFMDITIKDDTEPEQFVSIAYDGRFPIDQLYALRVTGDSMNLRYPDGTFVTCVNYAASGQALKNGMAVHIERHEGSLVETTLKIVSFEPGRVVLSPRSSNPVHKPIVMVDEGWRSDVVIKGIVTGSYRPEEF